MDRIDDEDLEYIDEDDSEEIFDDEDDEGDDMALDFFQKSKVKAKRQFRGAYRAERNRKNRRYDQAA